MKSIALKRPDTAADLHPLIKKRWSPRSFSSKEVTPEIMEELMEAARWSASSNNEQPWQYVYAFRGTTGFELLYDLLSTGNKPWTKNAAVLVVSMIRTTFAKNQRPNKWAEHDLGMANTQLILQALHRDIYAHFMAGFDASKAKEVLSLEEGVKPVCMIGLGYLNDPEQLKEPYRTREITPRTRKSINEFTKVI